MADFTVGEGQVLLQMVTNFDFETAAKSILTFEARLKELVKVFGPADDATGALKEQMDNLTSAALKNAQAMGLSEKQMEGVRERFSHAAAGIGQATQAARAAQGPLSFLHRASDAAGTALSRLGLSVRDVGIILGSGFLSGGVALIAREVIQLVTAVGRAAFEMARLGAEVQSFRDRLRAGFGEGAEIIEEFAEGSAANFGITEAAAIKLTGTIGNMFKSFGVGSEEAATFGVDLAEAARIIQRTAFTTDSYEEVLTRLKGGLTGNVEALREYGFAVNESTLRDTARAHGIALISEEMDGATKALLAYLFITDQANDRVDAFNETTESTLTAQQKLTTEWEEFRTQIGEGLVPALRTLIEIGGDAIDWLEDFGKGVQRELDPLLRLIGLLKESAQAWRELLGLSGGGSQEAFAEFTEGLGVISEEAERMGGSIGKAMRAKETSEFRKEVNALFDDFTEGKIEADEFFETLGKIGDISPAEAQRRYEEFFNVVAAENPALEKYRDELFATSFAQEEAEETLRKLNEETRQTPEFLKRVIDAYESLQEAIKDAAKAEKDAQKDLRDAREDAKEQVADALEAYEDAKRDEVKAVQKAQEAVAEAEEERVEAIQEAREKLVDAERERQEKIRDAERELSETRVEQARKVDDAERRLFEARIKRAEQITDAQLSLEEALHRGDIFAINRAQLELSRAKRDRGVKEAELALQDARIERIEAIEEAERKLAEARIDGDRKVREAKERLTEVIEDQNERVEEAQERLTEIIEQQAERVADAYEKLADTREKAAERIQKAEEKLLEVQEKGREAIDEARDKVLELEGGFRDTKDEVIELNKELDRLRLKLTDVTDLIFVGTGPADLALLNAQGRQHGGSVFSRHPYIVGESGPELFIPNHAGSVVPNEQLIRLLQQMMAGGAMTWGGRQSIQIPVYEAVDPLATAEAIAARLARSIAQ